MPASLWAVTAPCSVFCLALKCVNAHMGLHDSPLHDLPPQGWGLCLSISASPTPSTTPGSSLGLSQWWVTRRRNEWVNGANVFREWRTVWEPWQLLQVREVVLIAPHWSSAQSHMCSQLLGRIQDPLVIWCGSQGHRASYSSPPDFPNSRGEWALGKSSKELFFRYWISLLKVNFNFAVQIY